MQAVVAQTLRALTTCSGESFTEFGSNNVRSATQWRQCVDNTIQWRPRQIAKAKNTFAEALHDGVCGAPA